MGEEVTKEVVNPVKKVIITKENKEMVKGVFKSFNVWITKKLTDFTRKFKNLGFWILIFVMMGCCVGIWGTKLYLYSRLNETILLGGFVYNDKIYTVTQGIDKVVK